MGVHSGGAVAADGAGRTGRSGGARAEHPTDGCRLCHARSRVDDPARVRQPACGSSAGGRRHPVAQGRARPPCGRAAGADLPRRAAGVLPRPGRRLTPRLDHVGRPHRRRPRDGRGGDCVGGDDPQLRHALGHRFGVASTWTSWPTRGVCRNWKPRRLSHRPSRSPTSWRGCTAPRPVPPRC